MTAPPREPTKEMIEAGMRVWIHHGREIAAIYRAMHDAACAPSAEPKCNRCDDTGCSMCDQEWAQHQKPSAEPMEYVFAQHYETGRVWHGRRMDIPRRYFECAEPPAQAAPDADRIVHDLQAIAIDFAGDHQVDNTCRAAADLIEHQARELAAAREDAERYRWLRDTLSRAVGGGVEVNDSALVYETPINGEQVRVYWYPDAPLGFYESKGATLDAAIDAAKGAK